MTIAASRMPPSRAHLHPLALLKEGFIAFLEDNALSRGAAIAFYFVTAIAPVLFIATTIAGLVLGRDAASGAVSYQLRQIMSRESADMVQLAILHVRSGHHTLWGSLIGIIALIVTASGVFTEIEDALNVIWKAPRTESYLYQIVRGRVVSLALVICLGVLLLLSMMIASGIGVLGKLLDRYTDLSLLVIAPINLAFSLTIVSLLFAANYKLLPNTPLQWRDVAVGAVRHRHPVRGGTGADRFLSRQFHHRQYLWCGGRRHRAFDLGLLYGTDLPPGRRVHQGLGPPLREPVPTLA